LRVFENALHPTFLELRFGEVRILGILGSSQHLATS
jgi:hypothetical protein